MEISSPNAMARTATISTHALRKLQLRASEFGEQSWLIFDCKEKMPQHSMLHLLL
jgi:hypothetical protein